MPQPSFQASSGAIDPPRSSVNPQLSVLSRFSSGMGPLVGVNKGAAIAELVTHHVAAGSDPNITSRDLKALQKKARKEANRAARGRGSVDADVSMWGGPVEDGAEHMFGGLGFFKASGGDASGALGVGSSPSVAGVAEEGGGS